MPSNLEDAGRREVEELIEANRWHTTTHLDGILNDDVKDTFMNSLTCDLADVEDNKKQ